jgi:hypothetical protein
MIYKNLKYFNFSILLFLIFKNNVEYVLQRRTN